MSQKGSHNFTKMSEIQTYLGHFTKCLRFLSGVNILHYTQIKHLGKVFLGRVSSFWECSITFLIILMKNMNKFVDHMVYASLLDRVCL